LLLSVVTAAPPAGLTDPVELIRMSPETLVYSGLVSAVLTTVSAIAGAESTAASAPRAVDVRNKRIGKVLWSRRSSDRRLVGTSVRFPRGEEPAGGRMRR
jgi:hypothetical protein